MRTPITIISGYLGSGKTTLLLHLLKCLPNSRIGIIVNDIGELNIDNKTINQSPFLKKEDLVWELSNGSISSTLQEELREAVYHMAAIEQVDYILIESSGIASPSQIAKTLNQGETSSGKRLDSVSKVDAVVTVVDGYRILNQFTSNYGEYNEDFVDINQLIIDQIENCNILLFNKTDLLKESDKQYLIALVRKFQTQAKFIETTFSQVKLKAIVDTNLFEKQNGALNDEETEDLANFPISEADELGIESFLYTRRKPFHPLRLDAWLDNWPQEVIRCKGVMWLITQPSTVFKVSQSGRAMDIIPVGYWIATMAKEDINKMFQVREGLEKIWDPIYGDRMIELVFIGRNMDKDAIIRDLDACLLKPNEDIDFTKDPFNLTK